MFKIDLVSHLYDFKATKVHEDDTRVETKQV